jgi:hypothetical protein
VTCSRDRPPSSCPFVNADAGALVMCKMDSDCSNPSMGTNGRCGPGGRIAGCQCSYDQCFADGDCANGGVCECGRATSSGGGAAVPVPGPTITPVNVCKAGNCRLDKDCGAGGYCSPSLGSCGNFFGVVGYWCHTPKDKCVDDADCAKQGGGDCRYAPMTGAWECQTSQCAG